jgi:hypothetical protein
MQGRGKRSSKVTVQTSAGVVAQPADRQPSRESDPISAETGLERMNGRRGWTRHRARIEFGRDVSFTASLVPAPLPSPGPSDAFPCGRDPLGVECAETGRSAEGTRGGCPDRAEQIGEQEQKHVHTGYIQCLVWGTRPFRFGGRLTSIGPGCRYSPRKVF